MKKKSIISLIIILGVLLLLSGYGIFKISTGPGKYDGFAKCLTENDVVMYGTDWCHFCKQQKSKFGRSFRNIDYVNCDLNEEKCENAGVEGYPTWFINDKNYPGVQSLDYLAALTDCSLEGE